jgi:hypothetical protein
MVGFFGSLCCFCVLAVSSQSAHTPGLVTAFGAGDSAFRFDATLAEFGSAQAQAAHLAHGTVLTVEQSCGEADITGVNKAVVITDRGGCSFYQKGETAVQVGASALVIVDNAERELIPLGTLPEWPQLQLPVVMVSLKDGGVLKSLVSDATSPDSDANGSVRLSVAMRPSVLFLLPRCNPDAGGPIMVVELAVGLHKLGVRTQVAVPEAEHYGAGTYRARAAAAGVAGLILGYSSSEALVDAAGAFDAIVATAFPTVQSLLLIRAAHPTKDAFYFVQVQHLRWLFARCRENRPDTLKFPLICASVCPTTHHLLGLRAG